MLVTVAVCAGGSAAVISVAETNAAAQVAEANAETEQARQLAAAMVQEADKATADLADVRAALAEGFVVKYAGEYFCTAYCCEQYPHICGGNGISASGAVPEPGVTVAADCDVVPVGTWLYIDGVGIRCVQDSGSAIQENRLDVAVATHDEATTWAGYGEHKVYILEVANDG